MKNLTATFTLILSLVFVLSCGKTDAPPPEPLDPSNLVSELQTQFADADAEIKPMVDEVIKFYQDKNYIGAFQALDKVLFRSDLDEKSRILASRASLTISNLLDDQAAKGDEAAKRLKKNIMLYK